MTEQELRRIAGVVLDRGAQLRENAAYGGHMHDGGGDVLIAQADAFLAGLDRRLPPGWGKYAEQAIREADPDYVEYRRLRTKFGQ